MAYMNQEMKRELAPKIKEVLKKYNIKGTIAVRNHMALEVNIKEGPIDFTGADRHPRVIEQQKERAKELVERYGPGPDYEYKEEEYIQAHEYWIDENYIGTAQKFITEMIDAMKGPDYFNHDDAQTDYFHRSHYVDINIGQWNKPYKFTGAVEEVVQEEEVKEYFEEEAVKDLLLEEDDYDLGPFAYYH